MKNLLKNQAAQRAQAIAELSAESVARRIEPDRATGMLNRSRNTEKVSGINPLESGERGIPAEEEVSVFVNQSVQNETVALAIEQNRSEAKVVRRKWADTYDVLTGNRRCHARAARPEADWRMVLQQAGDNRLV